MNCVSLRVRYVGAEATLHGRTGWAYRPANATADVWTFHADTGDRVTCNLQDVTV